MEKIKTCIDENVFKEVSHSTFVLILVGFGVALLAVGLYVLFGAIGGDWLGTSNLILLISGVVLAVLVLLLLFVYMSNMKKAKDYIRDVEYDLTDEAIVFDVYRNDGKIENGKLYYKDLQDYKVTKNFVFVRLLNNTMLAITKFDGLVDFLQSKGLSKAKFLRINKK